MAFDEVIYDTIASGSSATQLSFFTHNQGDDTVSTTNLTDKNKGMHDFLVEQIIVKVSPDAVTTDITKLIEDASLRIYIDGLGYVIELPLWMCFSSQRTVVQGANGTLAADLLEITNPLKDGYTFDIPFSIPKDTTFNVYIELGTAMGTDTDITIALKGKKDAPGSV